MIPTMIGISIIIFLMVRLLPGDIVSVLAGADVGSDPELIEQAREQLGLTGSYPEQYWRWISGVLQGDLGDSLRNQEPVSTVLLDALPITFELMFLGLLIATVIGVPLGVLSAVKRDSKHDFAARIGGLIGVSIPSFWLATLLLLFTSTRLRLGSSTELRPLLRGSDREPEPVHPPLHRYLGVHPRNRDADGASHDARGARPGLRPDRARQGCEA